MSGLQATALLVAIAPMRRPPLGVSTMSAKGRRWMSTRWSGVSTSSFMRSRRQVPPAMKAVGPLAVARDAAVLVSRAVVNWNSRMGYSHQKQTEIIARVALEGGPPVPFQIAAG